MYATYEHVGKQTKKTLEKVREMRGKIIYSLISSSENYQEIRKPTYRFLQNILAIKAFRKGSWGTVIIEKLKPHTDDIIIEGKRW